MTDLTFAVTVRSESHLPFNHAVADVRQHLWELLADHLDIANIVMVRETKGAKQ